MSLLLPSGGTYSSALRPLDSYWMMPLALLDLQLVDARSWDLLASVIMWANSF